MFILTLILILSTVNYPKWDARTCISGRCQAVDAAKQLNTIVAVILKMVGVAEVPLHLLPDLPQPGAY